MDGDPSRYELHFQCRSTDVLALDDGAIVHYAGAQRDISTAVAPAAIPATNPHFKLTQKATTKIKAGIILSSSLSFCLASL